MPKYRYQAIDDSGKLFRGTVIAFNEADLEARLTQQGLTLIKSKQVKQGRWALQLARRRVKPRLLSEFYRRFSQTLDMGLPILTGLEENAKAIPSKPLREIIQEIKVALEGGNTLYEAMRRFPQVFHKLDLGIIRMGEESGVLPQSMKDLADFLEWKENIRSTIKRATIYPSFVMVTITAVIGVWVGYVLPQMAGVLTEMGITLPGTTKYVLRTSLFIKRNWPWIIGGVFTVMISLYILQKTQKGGILFHKYLLKVPITGGIAMNMALARLSHNFATMYRAGMPLNDIFEILTDNVLGNRYLELQLAKAFEQVQRGQSLAQGFENAGGFPPLLLGAVKHGELTGVLDDSFKHLGDYYDSEVRRTVQMLIEAMEPLTLFVLGGVFGLIVLSILLPLYDVIGGQLGKAY
nr:type II secretion system F family protein [Desulfobacterales bacterium]